MVEKPWRRLAIFFGWWHSGSGGTVKNSSTLPKFNMEPKNDAFQKKSPIPGTSFQVPCSISGVLSHFSFLPPHRGQDALKGKLARSFLGKKSSRISGARFRGDGPRRAITAPPGSNTASLVLAQHCLRSRGEPREKLGTWGPLLFIESWLLRLFQHTFGTHP